MQTKFYVFAFCLFGISQSVQFEDDKSKRENLENQFQYYDITEKNLTFQLFTRNNKDVTLFIGDKARLLTSGFNPSLPTKISTHGYMDKGNCGWINRLKEEILNTEAVNFIALDWAACAKNIFYDQAVRCMKKSGRYLGEFLKFLQKEGNVDLDKVHLIGHSLGAHLIAFASDAFSTKKAIGRMTGLDPAGPLFEHAKETERLNFNSAKFVDVIHTCKFFTGMKKPVGTIDFYPNGGYYQPGCANIDLACHHRSSRIYFIETVNKSRWNKYTGKKCQTLENAFSGTCNGETVVMGYHTNKSSKGIYYLNITSAPLEDRTCA